MKAIPKNQMLKFLYSLFPLGFWLAASLAQAQSVQCCNVATGDFSTTPTESACSAKPGHVPATAQNMGEIIACLQKAQDIAQEYMGMPSMPNIPGMPGGQRPLQTTQTSVSQLADCCHLTSSSWLGSMPVQTCLATEGQLPDTAEYAHDVKVCNGSGGGGGGGADTDDIEMNIANGGFEQWNGDEPVGFANFDGGNQMTQAYAKGGIDIQTVFKSTDAHTGLYSLQLKARKLELPPEVAGHVPDQMLPVFAGGLTSCGTNCSNLRGGRAGGGDSASLSIAVSEPGEYLCGVYKGRFVGGDQLLVNAGVHLGNQVVGGTNTGTRAMNMISRNAGQWTDFRMPITMRPGKSMEFDRASIVLRLQPAGNVRNIGMGGGKTHDGTDIKIDSVRFCSETGITIYKPKVISTSRMQGKISNSEEFDIGVQTFVNLDNDDKNGKFDLDDKNMSKDDNELVEMVLSLPKREAGFIKLELTGDSSIVKVWEDARKSKEFEFIGTQVELPGYMVEENEGVWSKTLWVEGLKPSTNQRDIKFEMFFDQEKGGKSENVDEVSMTVMGIVSIQWEGQANSVDNTDLLDLDPNWPAYFIEKSYRVFPGRRPVGGVPEDSPRNIVDVKVTLNVAPVRPLELVFRALDVDDPTAIDNDVDREDKINDNRGQAPFPWGGFPNNPGGYLRLEFDEIANSFPFRVTMQPGDNFRIVGGGDVMTLMELENDDKALSVIGPRHGIKIVDSNVFAETNSAGESRVREHEKYVSDVLTVWRFMYTEIDSMKPIIGNSIKGNIVDFTEYGRAVNGAPKYKLWLSANIYATRPSDLGIEGLVNSFQNGLLLAGTTTLQVLENTAHLDPTEPDQVIVSARHPEFQIDKNIKKARFTMFDDDHFHGLHKKNTPLPPIPLGRLTPAFQPAYVLPQHGKLKNKMIFVPFLVNYFKDDDAYLKSLYAFDNKAYHKDPGIWVVYLLNAFQGIATEDGDGEGVGAIAGQADGPGANSMGAVIYQESGKELEDQHKAAKGWRLMDAVPHEIGHLFGGNHSDEGLMNDPEAKPGLPDTKSEDFGPKTLDRIRRAKNP